MSHGRTLLFVTHRYDSFALYASFINGLLALEFADSKSDIILLDARYKQLINGLIFKMLFSESDLNRFVSSFREKERP